VLRWLSSCSPDEAATTPHTPDDVIEDPPLNEDKDQETLEDYEPERGPDLESYLGEGKGDPVAAIQDPVTVLLWYALHTGDTKLWKDTLDLGFKTMDEQVVLDLLDYSVSKKRLDLWNDVLGASFTGHDFVARKMSSDIPGVAKVLSGAIEVFGLEGVQER
jgi:hypothetical protein